MARIVSFGTLIAFRFIKGFQPIAGYNYGAKKPDGHGHMRARNLFCSRCPYRSGVWGLNGTLYAQQIADVIAAAEKSRPVPEKK